MRKTFYIIHNPTAGRRNRGRLERVVALLEAAGARIELKPTGRRGDAESFAREAGRRHYDAVVASGGDGTINEVVNGLAGSSMPLGIVPLGTANVLALELGLKTQPAAIAETILSGEPKTLWPGLIGGRRFVLMAGIGFDARVTAGVSLAVKRLLGRGAYVAETVRQWAGWRGEGYRVVIDGEEHRAAWVIVSKSRLYGGRFVCSPDASLLKPELQVCLMERSGRANLTRYMTALAAGRLSRLRDCRFVAGHEVEIDGPEGEPVQADGDTVARLPVKIGVDPNPLRVLLPVAAERSR